MVYIGAAIWHASGTITLITEETYAIIPAMLSITVGIFLFVLGVLGIIACMSENRCILSCFFSFLLVILLGEASGAILGLVYRRQLSTVVTKELKREVRLYGGANQAAVTSQLDYTQQMFQCCGVHNYTDWLHSPWAAAHPNRTAPVPDSCCPGRTCSSDDDGTIFKQGCYDRVEGFLSTHLGLIAGIGFSVAVIQMLGLAALCILMCRSRQMPYSRFGSIMGANEGLHV